MPTSKQRKNLEGQRFGRLIVVSYSHTHASGEAHWNCVCDCGGKKTTSGAILRRGNAKSCGCGQKEHCKNNLPAKKDITGRRCGRLVAAFCVGKNALRGTMDWLCICDCGKEKIVNIADLSGIEGHGTRSCGCLLRESSRLNARNNRKHGHCVGGKATKEYNIWMGMKNRCLCPTNIAWELYGGRGIKVCDRWIGKVKGEGFTNFLADLGPRPSPEHSLDRIDPYGNYEPSNCRWGTRLMQCMNQRRVIEECFKDEGGAVGLTPHDSDGNPIYAYADDSI
jgi:hypothetical protein